MRGFVIRKPDDFHVHLRDGEMLKQVAPDTASDFARALVMPNLSDPVVSARDAASYRHRIGMAVEGAFEQLMTIYLTKETTPQMIIEAGKAMVTAVKFYPRSGTTNSVHGLTAYELTQCNDVFAAMVEANMVLCLHGEDPNEPMLMRETAFLKFASQIVRRFPKLRVVIEHVTTAEAVKFVKRHQNVAATVTVHHLVLTTDQVIGDHDCLCMPVAKSAADRKALGRAVMSKHPRIFFGSDSAPHIRGTKNLAKGSFGLYTAPVALPLLAEIFNENGKYDRLEDFVSKFGAEFYQLPLNKAEIELVREEWQVEDPLDQPHNPEKTVRPFMAGKVLTWAVRRG